jgi:hypothetical protein
MSTPDCKASYAAAMKELAESFSPVEEVGIVVFEVVLMLWWFRLRQKFVLKGQLL